MWLNRVIELTGEPLSVSQGSCGTKTPSPWRCKTLTFENCSLFFAEGEAVMTKVVEMIDTTLLDMAREGIVSSTFAIKSIGLNISNERLQALTDGLAAAVASWCVDRDGQGERCDVPDHLKSLVDYFANILPMLPDDCHGTCDTWILNHWVCH